MSQPSESTLLNWRRQILAGTASEATELKLVEYVRDLNRTLGFQPAKLMDAYFKVAHKYPFADKEV